MSSRHENRSLSRLASLAEPARRALYEFVIRQDHEVSRDEAARGVKITRALAAFHLDRLVADGLLDTIYRRPPGRSGPGAGRPSKLYKRAAEPVAFTAPPQNYALIARMLSASIEDARSKNAADAAARAKGREIGTEARARTSGRPSDPTLLRRLGEVLAENGFEPVRRGREIRLRNCPFHALANDYRDLVCGMNVAMQQGVLDGLGTSRVEAVFEPMPGACCVAFRIGDPARGWRAR
ncbi:MAG TPA: transcriptional regulator [Actinomycetota bacterium]|nr:transcriptional regulator [Actinomycetota bacterium]